MNKQVILSHVAKIISEATDIDESALTPEKKLMDDIDLSSLEILTIIAEIEKKYKIRFKQSELNGLETLENLVDLIQSKS